MAIDMLRGALYIRVSTDEQTEYSPDAQKKDLIAYAKKNNIIVSNQFIFVDEGFSGKRAEKRPAFMRMIKTAKHKPKPFDVILVHKYDRFARNREDSVVYKSLLRKECGIKVISIKEHMEDDKFSIILESMLEAMAEYYSLNLADEVRKGMFEKASRGDHIGAAPLGYEFKDAKLVIKQNEINTVKLIFDLFNKNNSTTAISNYLNDKGIKTKRGATWRQAKVKAILSNPIYAGYIRYTKDDKELIQKGNHEGIIDYDNFKRIQYIFNTNPIYKGKNMDNNKLRSWLQKLVKCNTCGINLTINFYTNKYNTYLNFRCAYSSARMCKNKGTISIYKLERLVLERIEQDIKTNNFEVYHKAINEEELDELNYLNNELEKLQTKFDLIKRAFLAEIDSIEEYKKNKIELRKQEDSLILSIKKITENQDKSVNIIKINNAYKMLKDKNVSLKDKNKIASQIIKEIKVDFASRHFSIIYYS